MLLVSVVMLLDRDEPLERRVPDVWRAAWAPMHGHGLALPDPWLPPDAQGLGQDGWSRLMTYVVHYYRCDCVLVRSNGQTPRCQHRRLPVVSAQVEDVIRLQIEIDSIILETT